MPQWVKASATMPEPEFVPWNPQGGMTDLMPVSCPLTFTCTMAHALTHPCTKQINNT